MKVHEVREQMKPEDYHTRLNKASQQRMGFLMKEIQEGRIQRITANKEMLAYKDILYLIKAAESRGLNVLQLIKVVEEMPPAKRSRGKQNRINFPN